MKKIHYLLIAVVLFFGANSIFAKGIFQNEAPGLLFKISGKDLKKPSYIFGTIHIVCPNDMFSMETINSRFSETERLILELDMDDPTVMQKAAAALNMPEGKKLNELLTAEKYAKVDELFKSVFGVPVSALGQFSPFGLQTVIGLSQKSTGCAAPASYELKFVELATKAKLPVEGLESVDDQMAAIGKTPIEKQAEDLYKLSLDPEKTLGGFKLLLAEYLKKDAEALTTIYRQAIGGGSCIFKRICWTKETKNGYQRSKRR